MSEIINNNVIANGVKFVDFAGLDHFWSIAKAYIDAADNGLSERVTTLEGVVGDDKAGLVKDVKTLQTEVAALGGAEGGIQGMIDKSLESYSTTEQMNSAIATAKSEAIADADGKLATAKSELTEAIATATTDMATKTEVAATYETIANVAAVKSELEGKIATDVAAAIAEVVANAPEDLDTLKEIADYIASDKTGAAELSNRVADNEAILAGYKTVSESGEKVITTVKSDIEAAKNELNGAIATAKSEAIADVKEYVDGDAYKANFDEAGSADAVKTYVDGEAYKAQFDAAGAATTAAGEVKTYVDGEAYKAQFDAAGSASAVKTYVDGDEYKANFDAAGSAAAVKTYVDGDEYKANFDAAGSASTAESNANAYTDALANSIVVASLSDIDSIFGVTDHNHEA